MTSLVLLTLAIAASASVGLGARMHWPEAAESSAERLIAVVLWVVLPPCVFVNVSHFDIASGAGLGLAVGLVCLALGGSLAWFVSTRLMRLPAPIAGAVICAAIVANTGYFGLPATLIVFGSDAVSRAAAWDALLTVPVTFLAGFAVGAAYGDAVGAGGWRERTWMFARRNPVLWVLVPALLTPSAAIPDWTLDLSHIAFAALLPVGFFVLGVNLFDPGGVSGAAALAAPITVAVSIRLLLIPALFLAGCALLGGIPDSYFIQAAAPTGINALIVATMFGLDLQLTATAIAVSTAFAIVGVVAIGAF